MRSPLETRDETLSQADGRDADRRGRPGPQDHTKADSSPGTPRRLPDSPTTETRPSSTLRPPFGRALRFGRGAPAHDSSAPYRLTEIAAPSRAASAFQNRSEQRSALDGGAVGRQRAGAAA